MRILLLEIGLLLAVIAALTIVRAYFKIKYPKPKALGQILPELCVVSSIEIHRYDELVRQEYVNKPHLRRTLRRNQIKINSSYLYLIDWNTWLFQQVSRFEADKIDPGKSSFDYDPRETLALNLGDESADLRWEVVKARINLLGRAFLGLTANQQALMSLLGQYKKLEEDMIGLAGMSEDTYYHTMLIDRLGLGNWGIISGGDDPEPEPA